MTAQLATGTSKHWLVRNNRAPSHDANTIPRSASGDVQFSSMQFDCGYLSPFFITDPERMEVAFENAYVLIYEKKISLKKDLLPLLNQITKSGKPLLIIAEDVEGEALATLVVNNLRGSLQVAAVTVPGVGDQRKRALEDIGRLTGGKAVSESLGIQLQQIRIPDLGRARRIIIDKNSTMIENLVGPKPSHQPHSLHPFDNLQINDQHYPGS